MNDISIAKEIALKVSNLGGKVYYVGGYVRDKILNIENKDIDIEVHGITPKQLEEILTYYCNVISFEGTKQGVNYAAYRLFNKTIKDVNLAEAALLAGLVKSPTIYNTLRNEENAYTRKNLVLKAMLNNNYITKEEYNIASSLKISDLIKKKEKIKKE